MNHLLTRDHAWRTYNWFWLGIIAALFALGITQTLQREPRSLEGVNGAVTGILILADAAWFLYMMSLRHRARRSQRATLLPQHRAYVVVGSGIAVTSALAILHPEFSSLLFANIGIAAFAVDGWPSLGFIAVPCAVLVIEWLSAGSLSLVDATGDVIAIVSVIALVYSLRALMGERAERDRLIAQLRDKNQQLESAHRQIQIAHAHEVELAALRERNRLARDMHDSLGHALVLTAIKIEAAQRLQAVDPERAAREWEETKALVRSSMADLRHSLAGLRMPALEEQPFREALRELGLDLQRGSGIAVSVDAPEAADLLERPMQEALYRVAQEALANVVKHARAQHVEIRLSIQEVSVSLDIIDDGIGLVAAPRTEGAHYGITGMRERVAALGGTLTVGPTWPAAPPVHAEDEPGAGHPAIALAPAVRAKPGTHVRVTIPLPRIPGSA